jgi:hypothetical protein
VKIKLTDDAIDDLEVGMSFYEDKRSGLGGYFRDCLTADISSLTIFAGIHNQIDGSFYTPSNRFPFVIWYRIQQSCVVVFAVLDGRAEPDENARIVRSRT